MTALLRLLAIAAGYGRAVLVIGLLTGVAFPSLAVAMKPWLPELIALLLFIAALRIGPREALGAVRDLPMTAGIALVFQLAMPAAAILILDVFSWLSSPIAMPLILMLSASSISGSPNLAVAIGHNPAPASRMLILGTAMLPLTVLVPFWLMPELGSIGEVVGSAGRLLGVIAMAAGAAFAIRGIFLPQPSPETIRGIDGLSAIAMAVVVIGLVSEVGPAMTATPSRFVFWLFLACAANFGLQVSTFLILSRTPLRADRAAYSIVAGNRNIALFLVALPASLTDPLLLFIGCYQVPMYLTPVLLQRFYKAEQKQT